MKNIIDFIKKKINIISIFILIMILPVIFNSPLSMRILIEIGIISMVVLGLNLLMGLAGQISMGHAGIFGLSAYITGLLSSGRLNFTLPPLISIIIAISITTVLSYLIAFPILKLKGHYLAMGTLAMGIIFYSIFANLSFAGGFDGFSNIPRLWLFGENFTKNFLGINKYLNGYIIVYFVLIILFWISNNINNSKIGRSFKAIHTSEIAASTLGINVTKYKIMVFTISSLFTAIAGILFAHFYCGVTPSDFSIVKSISFVTMVVIGGTSSIWGALIGTIFLVLINYSLEFIQDFLSKFNIHVNIIDFNILTYGLLFIIVLIFLPDGIIGLKNKIVQLWRKKIVKNREDK
ncbi:MAG TPA: branched-chain amino acid ABC transporter permease [Spirochaetota bacterium]|nr:branched-chain amino acid ABC transporter permease [Spirochaetota bacterium]HOL58081.1 branched-chain amino acid ABC transporter permease [Spirochaetota bacterium]HPP05562.1 branched-chain amino acid ABC transporter permease [Spirochaetota bacterium]